MRHQAPLPAVLGILLLAATPPANGASPARPEIFTPATCDAAETAALRQPDGSGPSVYRTDKAFGIVLNYYRFKRKQAVAVSREDVGARLDGLARALSRPDRPPLLLDDPFVERFVRHFSPGGRAEPAAAAAAWRRRAARLSGRVQLVGEGERVTLYRPYLSQRTFDLIDATVFIIREPGGSCDEKLDAHVRAGTGLPRGPGHHDARTVRH